MPSKNVRSKRYRKRPRKVYRKRTQLSFTKAPLPLRLANKVRYEECISIDTNLGIMGTHVFSANGIYDPNITGTGHQPRGYDQLSLMYDHYVVIGSKISIKFVADKDVSPNLFTVGVAVKDSATVQATANDYIEGRVVRFTNLQTNIYNYPSKTQLSIKCSPKKFLGRSKLLADPELKGVTGNIGTGSNPSEGVYYHIFAQPVSSSTNPVPINIQVFIEYLVIWIEPKQPAQS